MQAPRVQAASSGKDGSETRESQVSARHDWYQLALGLVRETRRGDYVTMLREGVVIPGLEVDEPWADDDRMAEWHMQQAVCALMALRYNKAHQEWLYWPGNLKALRYHRARATQHRMLARELEQAFGGDA